MPRTSRVPVLSALVALVALAGALAAPRVVRAGACAPRGLWPGLMTPADRDLPAGEGLLVGHHGGRALTSGAARPQPDGFDVVASLERGATRIALDVEILAPGLARLVPHTAPAPGAWTLVSGEQRHELRVVGSSAPPALRAPSVREVWYRHSSPVDDGALGGLSGASGGRGGPSTFVGAEVDGPPPNGALAVIASVVYGGQSSPRMSSALATRSGSLNLYTASGGRCQPPSVGEPVPPGAVVRLQWVDAYGRLSPPSSDVTVVAR